MRNFQDELYGLRLLVLMEEEDGKFYQVMLNQAQFKKVSDAICTVVESEDMRPGFEMTSVETSDEGLDADIFIGMEDFYEE